MLEAKTFRVWFGAILLMCAGLDAELARMRQRKQEQSKPQTETHLELSLTCKCLH